MMILPTDHNHVILDTRNGSFHVRETPDGNTVITMYDHFRLTITGKTKRRPRVTLDSDEYDTELCVKQTESPWAAVDWVSITPARALAKE